MKELYDRFCRDVAAADPAFWAEWDAYRTAPDAPRSPVEVSDLIVRMAPHLSRFVAALFRVDDAAGELRARTHDLDALFRFKVDFVRKRALPLVKGGAHVHREARRRGHRRGLDRAVRGSRPRAGDRRRPAAACSIARRRSAPSGTDDGEGGARRRRSTR